MPSEPYLLRLGRRLSSGLGKLPAEARARHQAFVLSRQNADGGFSGREGGSDLYYTGFGLRGLSHVISTGCTSSTDAIAYAAQHIVLGRQEVMLAGGVDAPLAPGILAGFNLLIFERRLQHAQRRKPNGVTRLHRRADVFEGMMEMVRSKISNRSLKLFTLSGIYHATKILLSQKQAAPFAERLAWATEFWTDIIPNVKKVYPEFQFIAEVYWDLEAMLHSLGFDYCYDKRLYDRLQAGSAPAIRGHLNAGLDYQDRLARFLENHDEPRAAAAFRSATRSPFRWTTARPS
jgi:hypothetical protein